MCAPHFSHLVDDSRPGAGRSVRCTGCCTVVHSSCGRSARGGWPETFGMRVAAAARARCGGARAAVDGPDARCGARRWPLRRPCRGVEFQFADAREARWRIEWCVAIKWGAGRRARMAEVATGSSRRARIGPGRPHPYLPTSSVPSCSATSHRAASPRDGARRGLPRGWEVRWLARELRHVLLR